VREIMFYGRCPVNLQSFAVAKWGPASCSNELLLKNPDNAHRGVLSVITVYVNYPVKFILLDKLLHGYCAEFARATSGEETHADKSPESEVVSEDDVDSSAGRGAEILVVLFVPRPLPLVALIPVLIPLLTTFLIILPMARTEKPAPPSV